MPRRLLISFTKYAGFGVIAGVAFFAVGLLVASAFTPVAPGTITNPTTFGPTEGNVVLSALGGAWAFTGNVTMPGNGIWNSSGNVGINTPTPSKRLEVNGDAKVVSLFTEHAVLSGNTDIPGGFANLSAEGANRSLSLQAGSGRIWINRSGNVGIGIASPTEKLDVAGKVKATEFCIGADCKNAWPSGGSSTGDSSTLSKLQVTSPAFDTPSVANANLYLRGSDQGYGLGIGTRSTPSNQNGGVWLQGMVNDGTATPSNILLNQLGGNVGIGTASPNKSLHVQTASGNNAEIDIQSGVSPYWGIYQDEATQQLRFWNGDNRFTLTKDGNVGIGTTSPAAKLEVNGGNIRITAGNGIAFDNKEKFWRISQSGEGQLAKLFLTHDAVVDAVTIDGVGNVGIGTASPSAKLHVSGGEIVDKNNRIVTGAGAMHLLKLGAHMYSNNNMEVEGNTNVFSDFGTPLSFDLPAKGRVLFTGSFYFSRKEGIAAVSLRAKFDGTVFGSADTYIPWGHDSGSFTIGLSPADPPLSAGAHTLQVQVVVEKRELSSKISINSSGLGEGVRNVALYGYDYEP